MNDTQRLFIVQKWLEAERRKLIADMKALRADSPATAFLLGCIHINHLTACYLHEMRERRDEP